MYGNEDNLQSESLVKNFAESNDALIKIVDSEHYFHTKNQLQILKSATNARKKKQNSLTRFVSPGDGFELTAIILGRILFNYSQNKHRIKKIKRLLE